MEHDRDEEQKQELLAELLGGPEERRKQEVQRKLQPLLDAEPFEPGRPNLRLIRHAIIAPYLEHDPELHELMQSAYACDLWLDLGLMRGLETVELHSEMLERAMVHLDPDVVDYGPLASMGHVEVRDAVILHWERGTVYAACGEAQVEKRMWAKYVETTSIAHLLRASLNGGYNGACGRAQSVYQALDNQVIRWAQDGTAEWVCEPLNDRRDEMTLSLSAGNTVKVKFFGLPPSPATLARNQAFRESAGEPAQMSLEGKHANRSDRDPADLVLALWLP